MSCITAGDGTEYCDGSYDVLCPSEKDVVSFNGAVQLTETGRVIAEGVCACGSALTATLYSPPRTP